MAVVTPFDRGVSAPVQPGAVIVSHRYGRRADVPGVTSAKFAVTWGSLGHNNPPGVPNTTAPLHHAAAADLIRWIR